MTFVITLAPSPANDKPTIQLFEFATEFAFNTISFDVFIVELSSIVDFVVVS